jgi:hypothetical protein
MPRGEAAPTMDSINGNRERKQLDSEQIERLIQTLERFDKRFDEFAAAFLNARFPYGKPVDRWRRSA